MLFVLRAALALISEPVYRAGGDLLSCLCKKVSKEAHPATCVPLGLAAPNPSGRPAVLACGVRRRTHCAAVPLRSNNCGESDHTACVSCGTHATPPAVRLDAGRRVCESNVAVALVWLALVLVTEPACRPKAKSGRRREIRNCNWSQRR